MSYRVGLALGGGAARGWSHLGVIESLLEAGIEPVVVAGTSMGALVGGAYAAGRLEQLKEWALTVDRRRIASLLDVSLMRGGLIDGNPIQELLRSLGIDQQIEALPTAFAAVATDLADGREIWLREGPLDVAIRASISMPGIFSPVVVDRRWLVDGGLVNQVPVSTCRALGADLIIAVSVGEGLLGRRREKLRVREPAEQASRVAQLLAHVPASLKDQAERILPHLIPDERRTPGYFDVLVNSLNIMQEKITRSRLAGEPPHVLIAPEVTSIALMDFDRAGEAFEAGREAAAGALGAIREIIAR